MMFTRRTVMMSAVAAGLSPLRTTAQSSLSVAADAWRADLEALYSGMKSRHRDLFHLTSKARFDEEVARARNAIPKNGIFENIASFQHLVALAGDGHSFLFTAGVYRSYPFDTLWLEDGVRVIRTTPSMQRLLGARIDRIDGTDIAEVGLRVERVIAHGENAWYVLDRRSDRLRRAELLCALGVTRSPDRMLVEGIDADGNLLRVVVKAAQLNFSDDSMTAAAGAPVPELPWSTFGWRRIAEGECVHVSFRNYDDLPVRCAALFRDLAARPPKALLIDLRQNSGGDYTLPRTHLIDLLQSLPLNREGRLFVLIGRRTFSAAMTNTTDFRRETEALLVGEPTGARPNGFQELDVFALPNSGLHVACSARRYRFDESGRDAVYPDIDAKPTWADIASGRDAAVRASLIRAGLA